MATKIENSVVCVVTLIGLVLFITGSIIPAWILFKDESGLKRWTGIWFVTRCSNTSCVTFAHGDADPFNEFTYFYFVQVQILTTLAYVAAIIGCVLVVLGYVRSEFSTFCKAKSARCFLVVFALTWRTIGNLASEIHTSQKLQPEIIQGIPYGLVMSAFGTAMLFSIGIFNFISSQKAMTAQGYQLIHAVESRVITPNYQLINTEKLSDALKASYKNILFAISFPMSAVGFMLQLAGFVSPGWNIRSNEYDGMQLINTGLWYRVACDKSNVCKVESLHDFYMKKIDNYPSYELTYISVVGNEICATLSLFAAGLAVMFGLVVLYNREKSVLLLESIEICCLISGLLIWPVIGEIVGTTVASKRYFENHFITGTTVTFKFPYSAFLSALGSTILVVVYVIHTFKYFLLLCKIQRDKKISTENIALECRRLNGNLN